MTTTSPISVHRRLRAPLVALLLAGTAGTAFAVSAAQDRSNDAATDMAITADSFAMPASFGPLVKQVAPAVVAVNVERNAAGSMETPDMPPEMKEWLERFGYGGPGAPGQGNQQSRGAGSGFFIDAAGHIVTNHHVIADASSISVQLNDGRDLSATLVGSDPRTDLAVLKVEGDNFAHLTFGDSEGLEVGDWVIAVGNPFGLGGTVTAGIVSAEGRDISASSYGDFLQIDAPINRGNSGGPTFDKHGQVIGINTAIIGPNGGNVGIGFAIPSDAAKSIVAQLIAEGQITRGWLGVSLQPLDEIVRDALGVAANEGVLVASVVEGSPAESAGLQRGDVVVGVNGKPVDGAQDLSRRIGNTAPGTQVSLDLMRKGQAESVEVPLGAMPEPIQS